MFPLQRSIRRFQKKQNIWKAHHAKTLCLALSSWAAPTLSHTSLVCLGFTWLELWACGLKTWTEWTIRSSLGANRKMILLPTGDFTVLPHVPGFFFHPLFYLHCTICWCSWSLDIDAWIVESVPSSCELCNITLFETGKAASCASIRAGRLILTYLIARDYILNPY